MVLVLSLMLQFLHFLLQPALGMLQGLHTGREGEMERGERGGERWRGEGEVERGGRGGEGRER